MTFNNQVIVKNPIHSWLLRVAVLLVFCCCIVTTGFLSLQYLYKQRVEDHFLSLLEPNPAITEGSLMIISEDYWLNATGDNKAVYQPLLAQELGQYQSHRYIGWHSNVKDWLNQKGDRHFFLLYEVQYEKGTSEETFLFDGLQPLQILAREISIN